MQLVEMVVSKVNKKLIAWIVARKEFDGIHVLIFFDHVLSACFLSLSVSCCLLFGNPHLQGCYNSTSMEFLHREIGLGEMGSLKSKHHKPLKKRE